eukprot:357798-Chlamydomonas_euryale.AAC.21
MDGMESFVVDMQCRLGCVHVDGQWIASRDVQTMRAPHLLDLPGRWRGPPPTCNHPLRSCDRPPAAARVLPPGQQAHAAGTAGTPPADGCSRFNIRLLTSWDFINTGRELRRQGGEGTVERVWRRQGGVEV